MDIQNGHNFATGLPIDVISGSSVGFLAELKFTIGAFIVHTGTAVARNPCVSWADFILVFHGAQNRL